MNWPKELIIKRDITNTKVENKKDIINFISNFYDLNILENYLLQLNEQTKLNQVEIIDIVKATEMRINEIKDFQKNIELYKNDNEALSKFYEDNYKFVEGLIDNYIIEEGE